MAPDTQTLLARRRHALGAPYRVFYTEPVQIVRGEGTWVFDADGRRYLDAYNNVPCVGHSHPHVVEAIARQSGLVNTHTRYLSAVVVDYAERLLALLGGPLERVMFTCTGSEANDLALRIAREATGAEGIIVTRNADHGTTAETAAISPSLDRQAVDAEVVELVDAPRERAEDPAAFGRRVSDATAALRARGVRPAALVIDSVLFSDGIITEPLGFLREGARAIRDAGGVFIADEVQAGFGRTGTLWGVTRHEVTPDIVTLGKPMGNGYPLAGLATTAALLGPLAEKSRYFNTFAGTPVACAAGAATLDVLEGEGLVAHAAEVGAQLRDRLGSLLAHRCVRDVRGAGLLVAVEIDSTIDLSAPTATDVVERLRDRGVLVATTGPGARVVTIRPPLAFSAAEIDVLVDALQDALRDAP